LLNQQGGDKRLTEMDHCCNSSCETIT